MPTLSNLVSFEVATTCAKKMFNLDKKFKLSSTDCTGKMNCRFRLTAFHKPIQKTRHAHGMSALKHTIDRLILTNVTQRDTGVQFRNLRLINRRYSIRSRSGRNLGSNGINSSNSGNRGNVVDDKGLCDMFNSRLTRIGSFKKNVKLF